MSARRERKMIIDAFNQPDYSTGLMGLTDENPHIQEGGLKKGGTYLEFYHIATKRSAVFKAFLVSLSDSFNASFKQESAFGRSDPYHLHEGNSRSINVGFQVPAFDVVEAENNLAKISLLSSMLYPVYEEAATGTSALQLRSPPIIRIKFANLISNTLNPGGGAKTSGLAVIINNFAVNPNTEPGFFVVPSPSGDTLFPKLFDLSLDMSVIHEHTVGHHTDSKTVLEGMANYPYGTARTSARTLKEFIQEKRAEAVDQALGETRAAVVGQVAGLTAAAAAAIPGASAAVVVATNAAYDKLEDDRAFGGNGNDPTNTTKRTQEILKG